MNTREKQVELVKKLLKTGVSDDARMVLEKQFPEVVESEDERIRKAIFKALSKKEARDVLCDEHIEVSDALSYLEKQKEQNKSHLSLTEEELHKIRSEEYTNGFNDAAFGGKYKGWSEEDNAYLRNLTDYFECNDALAYTTREVIAWLKSLRPQPHWKPSDFHLAMLRAIINEPNNAGSEGCHLAMQSLYEALKKL